jgi:hypothetical protein
MNYWNTFNVQEFLLKFNNGVAMTDYDCDAFAMLYGWRWQVLATEVAQ